MKITARFGIAVMIDCCHHQKQSFQRNVILDLKNHAIEKTFYVTTKFTQTFKVIL